MRIIKETMDDLQFIKNKKKRKKKEELNDNRRKICHLNGLDLKMACIIAVLWKKRGKDYIKRNFEEYYKVLIEHSDLWPKIK